MAELSKTKYKSGEKNLNKLQSISEVKNKKDEFLNLKIFDLVVLIFSFLSVVSDLCTDLLLVFQYSYQGYKTWAIATFILIFFPSLVVQYFSLRWHITDKSAHTLHWVLHFLMLGIMHRYIVLIKSGYNAHKSRNASDIQKVYLDQSDLCMLHLFESFLESSPQLVLQIYVIATLNEWRFFTVLSAFASLVSLSWALAAYSKTQRKVRPNKNCSSSIGLLLLVFWSAGMLLARITTLVLGAYCFGNYIFLFITLHWLAMTLWIINQKTDFCESYWEERLYNAVVGVIYCFCFFNLQEGQSRWRILVFYLVTVFQNLGCLTIFLMWFGKTTPRLAVAGFIAIVGGTILGVVSMLIYYRFYHPSGPIKFSFMQEESPNQQPSEDFNTMTLRSLKQMRCEIKNNASPKSMTQSKKLLNTTTTLSDSVIVIEENDEDTDTDIDIKILQDWINDTAYECNSTSVEINSKPTSTASKDEECFKRRAICSAADLVKLIESKATETDFIVNSKLTRIEETPSEILSAHDYENLCAVNIARETWGLRSWKGYSDIENWLHDESVVNERLDTLTSTATSSDRSGSTFQKGNEAMKQYDFIDTVGNDSAQSESETNSNDIGQFSIESLTVTYPLGTLDPIFEEIEELSTSTDLSDVKIKESSVSTLVATIDKIRLNTPISNPYQA